MNETKKLQREVRRREAVWYLYTRIGWTMQEIADMFKCTRQNVKQILEQEAKYRKEDITNYYK